MVGLSEMMSNELCRKHSWWYVGYIKNRRKKEIQFRYKKEANSLFNSYKKKYKSAFMRESIPYLKAAKLIFNTENVLLKKLTGTSDLMAGKTISTPIPFGKL